MSLAHINRRFHLWSRSIAGRFMMLLLLAALVPGIRVAVEHAHAEGSHAHAHFEQLALNQTSEPDFAQPSEVQLHQHDMGTAASGLPPSTALHAFSISPDQPVKELIASAPAATPRSPPHRPPIA